MVRSGECRTQDLGRRMNGDGTLVGLVRQCEVAGARTVTAACLASAPARQHQINTRGTVFGRVPKRADTLLRGSQSSVSFHLFFVSASFSDRPGGSEGEDA